MKLCRVYFFRSPDGADAGAAPAAAAPSADAAAPAAAPAPAPSPAPAATADAPRNSGPDMAPLDMATLFNSDPFGEPAKPATPTPSPEPAAAAPPAQPTATPPLPAPTPAPQPAAPTEIETLRVELARTRGELEATRAQPSNGQQPQAAAPVDDTPAYDFQIPEALATALTSDDARERLGATQNLIKGTARAVHQTVVASLRREVAQVVPLMIQHFTQQAKQMDQIKTDFYGKYPQFDRPELRQMISSVGNELFNSGAFKQWSPEFRDAIAARVSQVLSGAVPAAAPAPAPTFTAPAAAPRPGLPAGGAPNAGDILRDVFTQ